MGNHAALPQ